MLGSSRRVSVFREDGFEKLSFEYVPSRLPHREDYVKRLSERNTLMPTRAASPDILWYGELIKGSFHRSTWQEIS